MFPALANSLDRMPEWRWARARHLVSEGLPINRNLDDSHVAFAVEFLAKLNECKTSDEIITFAQTNQETTLLYECFRMYDIASTLRWQTEALICSRVNDGTIAKYINLSPSFLNTYRLYFLDVEDRLNSPGFASTLFKSAFDSSSLDRDSGWKLIGFTYGPATLANLWETGQLTGEEKSNLYNIIHQRMLRQAVKAAYILDPNKYNALEIVENVIHFNEVEMNKPGEGDSSLLPLAQQINVQIGISNNKVDALGNESQPPLTFVDAIKEIDYNENKAIVEPKQEGTK